MTAPTGKRISRACLRCRRRKTKCNLDGIGEPQRPPCESCHRSASECILVESRRGAAGSQKRRQRVPRTRAQLSGRGTVEDNGDDVGSLSGPSSTGPDASLTTPSNYCSAMSEDFETQEAADDDNLHMELRNPSDALQILVHARQSQQGHDCSQKQCDTSGTEALLNANALQKQSGPPLTALSASPGGNVTAEGESQITDATSKTILDDYELVQRGLLHPSVLPELLHLFACNYHPYCPIVPPYMLGSQAMTKIQRSDYFLLTVILAVASRDMPDHILVHRYCWDHAQRLLLEVLLAHSWAQTPRTVQAILLLAEWMPYQIKQESTENSNSLINEDRSAWSLIGLAVRQGYLLRLDRAAFPSLGPLQDHESAGREEEKRLIWTFIYLADRQISVRMGQSFWSRGPSLSSKLTANDFPNLKSLPGMEDDDYASGVQANLELTQILYNAHGILYSSTERTLAMVNDGDYARYLDDFQRSATTWYRSWEEAHFSHNVRATLLLLYEYVCLYVNAFSFQAVLTRASDARSRDKRARPRSNRTVASLFSEGLMSSADGPYVYEAISSAKKILVSINQLHPRTTLRYLPTRYYLYGVYAAVFLHKAQCAGAFQSATQRDETFVLAGRFISKLEQISQDELHLCRRYSVMLRRIWRHRSTRCGGPTVSRPNLTSHEIDPSINSNNNAMLPSTYEAPCPNSRAHSSRQYAPTEWDEELVGLESPSDTLQYNNDATTLPDIEGYFLGSFFPGVTDVGFQQGFEDNILL